MVCTITKFIHCITNMISTLAGKAIGLPEKFLMYRGSSVPNDIDMDMNEEYNSQPQSLGGGVIQVNGTLFAENRL